MNIRKIASLFFICAAIAFSIPAFSQDYDSESGINSGNHGIHLRGALGAGQVFWGYISHSSESGDLGAGPGGNINIAAMYNYTLAGLEFNMLSGGINDLEWSDKDDSGVKRDWKSKGSGYYTVYDWKLGAKLFTEPGDMGYTFFYVAKRYWNTERKLDSLEADGIEIAAEGKRKANGDGWIYGYRDFSTLGMDDGMVLVFQSGFFFGKAPVSRMSTDGVDQTLPENESFSMGGELGAGVAFENIGFSVIGGMRGEINATSFKDSLAPTGEESVFGFGNAVFFIEAGMMF